MAGVALPPKNETDPKTPYVVGGDNTQYFTENPEDQRAWMDNLHNLLKREIESAAVAAGHDKTYGTMTLERYWSSFIQQADKEIFQGQPTTSLGHLTWMDQVSVAGGATGQISSPQDYLSGTGWQKLVGYARLWYQQKAPELTPTWETSIGSTSPGGGGGGSPMDLRSQFDVSQLAARAQDLYRGLLIDDLKDPRELARRYVDTIVAQGGTKKLDYDTFVKDSIRKTGRYAAIYGLKPPGMTEEQFLQPYYQSAQQVMGASPDTANVAIGGAMFGASSSAFQSRLQRTDANTSSAPFINSLEARMSDLKKVFKE